MSLRSRRKIAALTSLCACALWLCREYARIFQFQNFAATSARVSSELEEVERLQNQVGVLALHSQPQGSPNLCLVKLTQPWSVASRPTLQALLNLRRAARPSSSASVGTSASMSFAMDLGEGTAAAEEHEEEASMATEAAETATSADPVSSVVASKYEGFVASGSYVTLHVAGVPLKVSSPSLRRAWVTQSTTT